MTVSSFQDISGAFRVCQQVSVLVRGFKAMPGAFRAYQPKFSINGLTGLDPYTYLENGKP